MMKAQVATAAGSGSRMLLKTIRRWHVHVVRTPRPQPLKSQRPPTLAGLRGTLGQVAAGPPSRRAYMKRQTTIKARPLAKRRETRARPAHSLLASISVKFLTLLR